MNLVSKTMSSVAAAVVVLMALPVAAEPANGVPFEPRTGVYVETQLGVFTALGGRKMFSNAQPYLAVSFGVDLPVTDLSIFLTVAQGYNAGSCRGVEETPGGNLCTVYKLEDNSPSGSPDDFSVIPLELGARYAFVEMVPRLKATVAVVVGYQLLTPQVFENAPGGSPHAGLGLGVTYATRLPGLDIGAEVLGRFAFDPMLPSLSIYPRIRYVF